MGCGVLRNLRRFRAQRATEVPQHRRTATHEYNVCSCKLFKTTDASELTVFHSCLAFAMGNSSSVVSSLPESFSGPMNSLYDAAGKNAYNLVGLAVLAVAVSWFTKRPKGPFPPGPKVRLNLDVSMPTLFSTNHLRHFRGSHSSETSSSFHIRLHGYAYSVPWKHKGANSRSSSSNSRSGANNMVPSSD